MLIWENTGDHLTQSPEVKEGFLEESWQTPEGWVGVSQVKKGGQGEGSSRQKPVAEKAPACAVEKESSSVWRRTEQEIRVAVVVVGGVCL